MISVILSFRFTADNTGPEQRRKIEQTFNFWAVLRDFFNLELIFVNDHTDNFWIDEDFIVKMPGKQQEWNQCAARNYGASLAKGDKLLFTDIDHIFYGDFNLLNELNTEGIYISFPRLFKRNGNYESIRPAPNLFLITKPDFIPYDEDFCGNYGYEDTELFFRLKRTCTHRFSDILKAYLIGLKSATYSRDLTINKQKLFDKTGIVK